MQPLLLLLLPLLQHVTCSTQQTSQTTHHVHHHTAATSHCLDHVWRSKLQKHADLVSRRASTLAESDAPFRTHVSAYDAFEPTYTCHSEWRTGVLYGDGGKFVCGEPAFFRSKPCLTYSVGSNGDTTFEADVIKRFGCEVHTFDPTGNTTAFDAAVTAAGAHFHPWGVGATGTTLHNSDTGVDNELVSLADIVHRLGHTGRHIDILKIDCEGCEYTGFAELWPHIRNGTVSVGQIQVELHGVDFDQVRTFFAGAEDAGYMIFHKERNQWGCGGANCVEYALIHASEARRIFEATHCGA